MYIFYLLALLPALLGVVLYFTCKEITILEWLGASAASFILAAIMHAISLYGMTSDTQTLSGRMTRAIFYPRWVERYTETHSRTVGYGKNKHTTYYTDTHYRTHSEEWHIHTTLDQDVEVEQSYYNQVVGWFGGEIKTVHEYKSGFHSGDHNVYYTDNKTGYIAPVIKLTAFENRIKAAPSTFSFAKVPPSVAVFPYPPNNAWNRSDRLVGTAKATLGLLEFDRLNARLGPTKRVNVILVGFNTDDSSLGQWQQSAWIGGKKNDLVLCYGGTDPKKPSWSFVFGWTEKDIVKRNLETILLEHPVDDTIIPRIEAEVRSSYVIKDWHEFDYITIRPKVGYIVGFVVFMVLVQAGLHYWFITNEFNKEDNNGYEGSGFRQFDRNRYDPVSVSWLRNLGVKPRSKSPYRH